MLRGNSENGRGLKSQGPLSNELDNLLLFQLTLETAARKMTITTQESDDQLKKVVYM